LLNYALAIARIFNSVTHSTQKKSLRRKMRKLNQIQDEQFRGKSLGNATRVRK